MTYNREYTPEFITELKPNEIFVFGSNIHGYHGGGAAAIACRKLGAEWGVGEGITGPHYLDCVLDLYYNDVITDEEIASFSDTLRDYLINYKKSMN